MDVVRLDQLMTKDFDFKHYYCEYGKYEMRDLVELTKKNMAKLWCVVVIQSITHSMKNLIVGILIWMTFLAIANSKVIENRLNIQNFRRNEGWNYLGRMVLSPGKVEVALSVKLKTASK